MKEKRIIVAGTRNFQDYNLLKETLISYIKSDENIVIVSGCANGADTLGERFAKENNIRCVTFPALWNIYGKAAGYRRNTQMAMYATHDAEGVLFAFWDGESKGTEHMIDIAKEYGLEMHVVNF